MKHLLRGSLSEYAQEQHIWWGVSVEDQKYGLPRIDELRSSAATVKFLSIEPLLEDLGQIDLTDINWVIVGGESGPRARPMHPEWVLSIKEQCGKANVPFFFKQWGGFQKSKNGRILENRVYDEMPKRINNQPVSMATRLNWINMVSGIAL
jgi:protein gp37